MAMTDAASKCLQVFMYYSEQDQENALKLMKYVEKESDIFCFGLDRTPGKCTAQCMEQAIDIADYFILFLSPQLLGHIAWIRAIVHKVKQDINNKLTIVLYGMSKDEFANGLEEKFDLVINQENVIYDPWTEWDTVAKHVFKNMKLKSTTSYKTSGKKAPKMKIGIIHDDDVHQRDNTKRAKKIAQTISNLYPNDQVIWSDHHDFGFSMRIKDTNIKFLKHCQQVFVILTRKWKTSNWNRHFPSIISEAGYQRSERHKITFILLDKIKKSNYGEYSLYNAIEIDRVSNISDSVVQKFIKCIESAREMNHK